MVSFFKRLITRVISSDVIASLNFWVHRVTMYLFCWKYVCMQILDRSHRCFYWKIDCIHVFDFTYNIYIIKIHIFKPTYFFFNCSTIYQRLWQTPKGSILLPILHAFADFTHCIVCSTHTKIDISCQLLYMSHLCFNQNSDLRFKKKIFATFQVVFIEKL